MNKIRLKDLSQDSLLAVAEKIGNSLKGGEVIELIGDVGAGKTTFVKGLAKGAGYTQTVSSPTYVIQQIYEGRVTLQHFDFYRLDEPGLVRHTLNESIDKNFVAIIEWANTVENSLPKDRLKIQFQVSSESTRDLYLEIPTNLKYLDVQ